MNNQGSDDEGEGRGDDDRGPPLAIESLDDYIRRFGLPDFNGGEASEIFAWIWN